MSKKVLVVVLVGLVIRLLLTVPAPFSDAPAFRFWALYLQDNSLSSLFVNLPGGYTPYPPLYYYVLGPLGFLISLFGFGTAWFGGELILRLPVYGASVATALVIYSVAKRMFDASGAFYSAAFFILHPALIITDTLWGQFDSVVILATFLTVWLLMRRRFVVSWILFVAAALIKLQTFAVAPIIAALALPRWRKFLRAIPLLGVIGIIPFVPVLMSQGLIWTVQYFAALPHWYPYTSVYAGNVWSLFGFLVPDSLLLFHLVPIRFAGLGIVAVLSLIIIWPHVGKKQAPSAVYFAAFLLFFTFALWSTRVHSRYFVYALGFLSLFAPKHTVLAAVISLIMVLNLLLPATGIGIDSFVLFLQRPEAVFALVVAGVGAYSFALKKYQTYLAAGRVFRNSG